MPTYQYACTGCGQQLEVVQKFSDDPLVECPSCQGRLRKVFSAVGVVFKGSGFYRTDSRAASKSTSGSSPSTTSTAASTAKATAGSASGSTTSQGSGSTSSGGSEKVA